MTLVLSLNEYINFHRSGNNGITAAAREGRRAPEPP